MFFEIEHETQFRYSKPVFIEPVTIRLRPLSNSVQKLHFHEMKIHPQPAGHTSLVDLEGNDSVSLWFDGMHDRFSIKIRSSVETLRENAFDFFVTHPEFMNLPAEYPESQSTLLQPYATSSDQEDVKEFAQQLQKDSENESMRFIQLLTESLYRDFECVVRDKGDPYGPEETLHKREGACRDLTVLFMEVCRTVGIAARFVSGYQEGDPETLLREMHAWPEVYIPGGGWRGFDPTHGLALADRHVMVATGRTSSHAAPTSGTFRGTGATSTISFQIAIATKSSLPPSQFIES